MGSSARAARAARACLSPRGHLWPRPRPFRKRSATASARRIVKAGQVCFPAPMWRDIAQVLTALPMARPDPGSDSLQCLATDDPAPPQDVIAHAAELLGCRRPPEVPFDTASLSPIGRQFLVRRSKRVDNRRIKEDLGVRLRYPTYLRRACRPAVGGGRDLTSTQGRPVFAVGRGEKNPSGTSSPHGPGPHHDQAFRPVFFCWRPRPVVGCEPSRFIAYDGPEVTRIVVHKIRARGCTACHHDEVLEGYDVELGFAPWKGTRPPKATGARRGAGISSTGAIPTVPTSVQ